MTRRDLAQALALCGCAAVALKPGQARAEGDSGPTLQKGDRFAKIVEGSDPKPIKADDMKPGDAIMGVYPIDPATGKGREETRFNMVNLAKLKGDHKNLAATQGITALSAICTHKACAVESWQPDESVWRCFCHMSEFDAANKGERIAGPAISALPNVPIEIDAEGYIVAKGGFSAEPGADS